MGVFRIRLARAFRQLVVKSSLFVGIISISVSAHAHAQQFIEDIHYSVIDSAIASSENQVVEYFSFSCPGCYALEPTLSELLKLRPELNFERVHMPFGGRFAKYSQKAFVVMSLLDAMEHKSAVFSRIHSQRNPFDSDSEVISFFVDLGYQAALVEETLNSFSADTMIRKMTKRGVDLKVRTVPSLVVNDKYLISMREVGSISNLIELVDYLYKLRER